MPTPYDYRQIMYFEKGTSFYQLDPTTGTVAFCVIEEDNAYQFPRVVRHSDHPDTPLAPIELSDVFVEAAEEPDKFLFFRTRKQAYDYYAEHFAPPTLIPGDLVLVGMTRLLPKHATGHVAIVIRADDTDNPLIEVQLKAGASPHYASRGELVRIGHTPLDALPSVSQLIEQTTQHQPEPNGGAE